MAPRIRVGISGWTYPPWRGGVFYPEGLSQKSELAHASTVFETLEINGTFYALQKPKVFQSWAEAVPRDFVFSVKAPRFITHIRRLAGVGTPVANFLASGILALGEKLGPILWQVPPTLKWDSETRPRWEAFLGALPLTHRDAARLAQQHDAKVEGRAWTDAVAQGPLMHAIEVRHDSYQDPAFLSLVHGAGAVTVIADSSGRWPMLDVEAGDFRYVRLHGNDQVYPDGYLEEDLRPWCERMVKWKKPTFVYFDSDIKTTAPRSAQILAKLVGMERAP